MKMKRSFVQTISLLVGSGLMALAGLNWNIGIAAWLAPVFLLYFTKNSRWPGFLFLFLCMGFSSAISKTGENITGIFIISVITGLSFGILFTLPYLIERLVNEQEEKFHSTLVFPASFVLIEYLFSLKYGMWGHSAIAQYSNLNLIQISSVFGLSGISFLVFWFASCVNWLIKYQFDHRRMRKVTLIYGSVFVVVLFFGQLRIGLNPAPSETVKTAAIIGKTDIHQIVEDHRDKLTELSEDYNFPIPDSVFSDNETIEWQFKKTSEAASQGAKIIVWNEISLFLNQDQVIHVLESVKKMCLNEKVFVLLSFLEKNETELPKPFNNKSVLITPEGKIAWEYIKVSGHPIENIFFNKGILSIPYLDTEFGRIGNVICADLDLTRYISQAGKNAIDMMLVPAFDWEGITPYHANMANFAAIQYGFSLVRSNGKGLSTFCDHQGNIIARQNSSISGPGIICAELPVKSTTTIYSKTGDLFVYIIILYLLLAFGIRISEKMNHVQGPTQRRQQDTHL